jgi:hypothetical protein
VTEPIKNHEQMKHAGGRPRKYDREFLQDELIKWSEKEDSVVLTQFSSEYCIDADAVLRIASEDKEFHNTLRLVRNRLAARRELMHNQGAVTANSYNRYVKHYDTYLKHDEREEFKFEKETAAKASADAGLAQDNEITIQVIRDRHRNKVSTENIPTQDS